MLLFPHSLRLLCQKPGRAIFSGCLSSIKPFPRDHLSACDLSDSRTRCFECCGSARGGICSMSAVVYLPIFTSLLVFPFLCVLIPSCLQGGEKKAGFKERRKDGGPGGQQGFPRAECNCSFLTALSFGGSRSPASR